MWSFRKRTRAPLPWAFCPLSVTPPLGTVPALPLPTAVPVAGSPCPCVSPPGPLQCQQPCPGRGGRQSSTSSECSPLSCWLPLENFPHRIWSRESSTRQREPSSALVRSHHQEYQKVALCQSHHWHAVPVTPLQLLSPGPVTPPEPTATQAEWWSEVGGGAAGHRGGDRLFQHSLYSCPCHPASPCLLRPVALLPCDNVKEVVPCVFPSSPQCHQSPVLAHAPSLPVSMPVLSVAGTTSSVCEVSLALLGGGRVWGSCAHSSVSPPRAIGRGQVPPGVVLCQE